jgi:hypothetical protein
MDARIPLFNYVRKFDRFKVVVPKAEVLEQPQINQLYIIYFSMENA